MNMKALRSGLRLWLFVACFFSMPALAQDAAPGAAADVAPEKRAEIEKLLDLTGALKLGQQMSAAMVAQMTNVLRASHPDIPQKALDVLPEEVNAVVAAHLDTFKEMMVVIYADNYSLDDIKGLNQFYSTPLGQKVISTMPTVMQQSMAVGQRWGQSMGPEIGRRIQARFAKDNITL